MRPPSIIYYRRPDSVEDQYIYIKTKTAGCSRGAVKVELEFTDVCEADNLLHSLSEYLKEYEVRMPEGQCVVPLTKGLMATVDPIDYEWALQSRWSAQVCGKWCIYARRSVGGIRQHMHRCIAERKFGSIPRGMMVDHKDRNTLNNCRSNLRLATDSQNKANRGAYAKNTSGAKGVCQHPKTGKWIANLNKDGKSVLRRYCDTKQEAVEAYMEAARIHFGEFASA